MAGIPDKDTAWQILLVKIAVFWFHVSLLFKLEMEMEMEMEKKQISTN